MSNVIIDKRVPLPSQIEGLKSKLSLTVPNLLGVASSMRPDSYSTKSVNSVLENAKKYDTNINLLDLRELSLPPYDPSRKNHNESLTIDTVSSLVNWADVFILASPDYHGSMSGTLKNFLDYYWHEFSGKLFGYIVASHEKGLTVMDQMRTAVRQCYGWSLPYGLSVNGEIDIENGNLNPRLAKRIDMMARDIAIYGRLIRAQFQSDVENNITNSFATYFRKS